MIHASTIALTRAVSPTLARCQLTHVPRQPIDTARANVEHDAYEEALRSLGATVVRVAPAPDLPDAVFVEDTAIVLDELAVISRPGAASRRQEIAGVAERLAEYRPLRRIRAAAHSTEATGCASIARCSSGCRRGPIAKRPRSSPRSSTHGTTA